jgi:ATP-dependent Lon protease
LSYIRSNASRFQIDPDFFRDTDIHIHIPSGAIPKDGPSAGITIAFALLSLLTKRPARRNVALTGELTLSGRILPVGGIREKVLAAKRAGVSQIVFPLRNQVDVKQLEKDVVQGLEVFFAREIPDVLDIVLMPPD